MRTCTCQYKQTSFKVSVRGTVQSKCHVVGSTWDRYNLSNRWWKSTSTWARYSQSTLPCGWKITGKDAVKVPSVGEIPETGTVLVLGEGEVPGKGTVKARGGEVPGTGIV
jgi:hypothetical protein